MTAPEPRTTRFDECPTCHHRIYESPGEAAAGAGLREAEHHAADAILDRPHADPDDDAAIVSRAALAAATSAVPERRVREMVDEGLAEWNAKWRAER